MSDEPGENLTGSTCVALSARMMELIATPWEWSILLSRENAPRNASLLVRTRSPRRGERRGSERVTSRQRSMRSTVPSTPAAKITLRERADRKAAGENAVEDRDV